MKTIAAIAAVLATLTLVACGGGGGDTTATSPGDASSPAPPVQRRDAPAKGGGSGSVSRDASASFTPPSHDDSGGGAAPFETRGGDNSIQEFGAEASGADFEAAATALHGYLDARAAGAWRDACAYLAPGVAGSLAQLAGGSGGGGGASCPETLASLSAAIPTAVLEESAEADVAALRVEGDRAFLLFHGAHDADYFIPMTQDDGAWKIAAIAPSAIP
ncbi:MAG TPA: hypothetical protein VF125_01185 [Solirubrobacterales bacterium]